MGETRNTKKKKALSALFISTPIFFFNIRFLINSIPFLDQNLSSISSSKTQIDFMASTKNQKGNEIFVPDEQDVLQRHVAFFDRNHDGVVYPWETFQGFRAIGCGLGLSTFASIFINGALSGKTRPGKFPNLLFPVVIKNIHKAKHGSDSGVYDFQGRFVLEKFEEIFANHAHTHPEALTSDEVMGMLKANREPKDFAGWVGSYTEWKILYVLCKDKSGLLRKDTIQGVYDGSLFERMEKERSSAKKKDVVQGKMHVGGEMEGP